MRKLVFFISLSLLTLVGCENKYEYTIWINNDAECCGVKDPLNNLEWLKRWYNDSYLGGYPKGYFDTSVYQIVYLFHNDSTLQDCIITRTFCDNYKNYFEIFSCDGYLIDHGRYNYDYTKLDIKIQKTKTDASQNIPSVEECNLCNYFLKTYTLVDTIAYIYTDDFIR